MLDGGHHEIAHLLASDPARGRDIAHRLAITAVEGEGNTDPLAILAPDLKPIRAPAPIRLRDGDPAVMTSLSPACMALEQERVLLHDPVDPFMVCRRAALGQRFPAPDGVHPAIAIGRQVSDDGLDLGDQRVSRGRRTPDPLARALLHLLAEAGACASNHLGHGLHREPP